MGDMIKGPGLGEKVNELRGVIKEVLRVNASLATELHGHSRFWHDNRTNHTGRTFRKCDDYHCREAVKLENQYKDLSPVNPYRYGRYRANLRKLQKAIKSTPQLPEG